MLEFGVRIVLSYPVEEIVQAVKKNCEIRPTLPSFNSSSFSRS